MSAIDRNNMGGSSLDTWKPRRFQKAAASSSTALTIECAVPPTRFAAAAQRSRACLIALHLLPEETGERRLAVEKDLDVAGDRVRHHDERRIERMDGFTRDRVFGLADEGRDRHLCEPPIIADTRRD